MNEKTISFTTYGPNRGKTITLGNYHFEDGVCHIQESDAAKAASILHNYHDVCYEHELEAKAATYDQLQGVVTKEAAPPSDNETDNQTTTRRKAQDKP